MCFLWEIHLIVVNVKMMFYFFIIKKTKGLKLLRRSVEQINCLRGMTLMCAQHVWLMGRYVSQHYDTLSQGSSVWTVQVLLDLLSESERMVTKLDMIRLVLIMSLHSLFSSVNFHYTWPFYFSHHLRQILISRQDEKGKYQTLLFKLLLLYCITANGTVILK